MRPRIAVAGGGPWGRNHIRVLHRLGVLDSVCDEDPVALHTASAAYAGITDYSSFDHLLKYSDADAVVIATPAQTHVPLALRALADGRSVLVEKPVTMSTRDAVQLAQARSPSQLVAAGHLLLHHPAFVALQRLCAEGSLGDVGYVGSRRQSPGRRRPGESVLWSFGPHDISMVMVLFGGMPTDVICRSQPVGRPLADIAEISLRFPGTRTADVSLSWVHTEKIQRMTVSGPSGSAVFDDRLPPDQQLCITVDRASRCELVAGAEPLEVQASAFLHAMDGRCQLVADEVSAFQVAAVLEACEQSAAAGGERVSVQRLPAELVDGMAHG